MQDNIKELEIAHQNIFETLRVLTHPKFPNPMSTNDAIKSLENILSVCTIISPDYKTHRIALELIDKYHIKSDQIFDAYLVGTAISNGIDVVVTDNVKDLQVFREIKVINPFDDKLNSIQFNSIY